MKIVDPPPHTRKQTNTHIIIYVSMMFLWYWTIRVDFSCLSHTFTISRRVRPSAMPSLHTLNKSKTVKKHVRRYSRNWVARGYLAVVTVSTWLLRDLRSCDGVNVSLFVAKIALRGFIHTFTWWCDHGIIHLSCLLELFIDSCIQFLSAKFWKLL